MSKNTKIGIVTAAGYTEAEKYYNRLHGLLNAINTSTTLTSAQKQNILIMGGESNFLFKFSSSSQYLLEWLPRRTWILPDMHSWSEDAIQDLLSVAEKALRECISTLRLPAIVIRKARAVGIVHEKQGAKFPREQLEETVLVVQKILEMSEIVKANRLPFCAFNGGNDVFVDIGDKSWGVMVCQRFFGNAGEDGVVVPVQGSR